MHSNKVIRIAVLGAALVLVCSGTACADNSEKGKLLYASRCAFCHGASGKGDGPAGAALKPPPTDFTSADFWKRATPEHIADAIEHGKPGTAMVAFKSGLTDEQLHDLVVYLQTFKPQ